MQRLSALGYDYHWTKGQHCGSGIIIADLSAKAKPDGYALLMWSSPTGEAAEAGARSEKWLVGMGTLRRAAERPLLADSRSRLSTPKQTILISKGLRF